MFNPSFELKGGKQICGCVFEIRLLHRRYFVIFICLVLVDFTKVFGERNKLSKRVLETGGNLAALEIGGHHKKSSHKKIIPMKIQKSVIVFVTLFSGYLPTHAIQSNSWRNPCRTGSLISVNFHSVRRQVGSWRAWSARSWRRLYVHSL